MLFGGNKGYEWMVSFLGLMDTIKLKPKQAAASSSNKDVAMTQYMLKLLTILSNILVGNLIALQSKHMRIRKFPTNLFPTTCRTY